MNRSNQTHASTTDPDAKLYKKLPGSAAKRWVGCTRRVTAARPWSGGCSRWRQRR